MKRWYGVLSVCLILFALTASAQVGAKSKADPRLRKALDESQLKYAETPEGDFKLLFNLEDDRTQLVFVESNTETMGIIEVREVWSIGWKGNEAPSAEVANKLLLDNHRKKIGAWELVKADDTYYAVFNVKVSADCGAEALKSIIVGVAQTADEMEKELLESDEY